MENNSKIKEFFLHVRKLREKKYFYIKKYRKCNKCLNILDKEKELDKMKVKDRE